MIEPEKDYRNLSCLISLIAVCLILLGGVIGKILADDHPLCSYFAELANEPNVSVAKWIGYPEGWEGYHTEWDYETITDLANGSGIITKAVGKTRWLFAFRSFKEDNGNHDLCEHVLIVDDSP